MATKRMHAAVPRSTATGSQVLAGYSFGGSVPERSATVDRILEAALKVLAQQGYAELSLRRVAAAASIAPGNLTYHFPSKRQLMRAVIGRMVDEYSRRLFAFLEDPQTPSEQKLEKIVRWYMADSISPPTVRIFRELWAMALHDVVIRNAMDDLYDTMMDALATAMQRAHPRANIKAIQELIQLLAFITEGSAVLYGTRPQRVVPYERVIELAISLIDVLAPDLRTPG